MASAPDLAEHLDAFATLLHGEDTIGSDEWLDARLWFAELIHSSGNPEDIDGGQRRFSGSALIREAAVRNQASQDQADAARTNLFASEGINPSSQDQAEAIRELLGAFEAGLLVSPELEERLANREFSVGDLTEALSLAERFLVDSPLHVDSPIEAIEIITYVLAAAAEHVHQFDSDDPPLTIEDESD